MQTVYGAASLAAESSEEPGVLRKQVTSPNGTTAAALGVLMGDDRLKDLVGEAVEAARSGRSNSGSKLRSHTCQNGLTILSRSSTTRSCRMSSDSTISQPASRAAATIIPS